MASVANRARDGTAKIRRFFIDHKRKIMVSGRSFYYSKGVLGLKERFEQILERLDSIDQRLNHQGSLLAALQHSAEVARAERESIIIALARSGGQIAEISRLSEDIINRMEILGSVQELIKENLRDQALDINLLKKIISF